MAVDGGAKKRLVQKLQRAHDLQNHTRNPGAVHRTSRPAVKTTGLPQANRPPSGPGVFPAVAPGSARRKVRKGRM